MQCTQHVYLGCKTSCEGIAAEKGVYGLSAGVMTGSLGSLTSLTHGGSLWDSGEWWMLLAAQSMAVGTVMVPWVCKFADPIMATGYHMLLGGLPLLALSVYRESDVLLERLPQLTGEQLCLFCINACLHWRPAPLLNLPCVDKRPVLVPQAAPGEGLRLFRFQVCL